jgi:hypothetical protein
MTEAAGVRRSDAAAQPSGSGSIQGQPHEAAVLERLVALGVTHGGGQRLVAKAPGNVGALELRAWKVEGLVLLSFQPFNRAP